MKKNLKTLDLPFVVAPAMREKKKLGNSVTGIVEVPVFGCLTVGEVVTLSELTAQNESAVVVGAKLAEKISIENEISLLEAFALVEDAAIGRDLEEKQDQIRIKYLAEIAEITRLYIEKGREKMIASVTTLIKHRLDRPSWTNKDTLKISQSMLDILFEFFEEEKNQGIEVDHTPPKEEDIKKPPEEESQMRT